MNSNSFLEFLASWLGQTFGQVLGQVVGMLLFFFILYLFWGLPWSLIISKLGFQGRAYWILFWMMCAPLVAFAIFTVGWLPIAERISGLTFGLVYLGLLVLAFASKRRSA